MEMERREIASVDLCEPNLELLWEDQLTRQNKSVAGEGEEMSEFLAWRARFPAPSSPSPNRQYRVSANQQQYIKTLIQARD